MKTILLILLATVSTICAQTVISLQGGMNSRTGVGSLEDQSPIAQSWKSATSASVGIDYFLNKPVALSSNIEYDYYSFDAYRFDGVTIPEIWFKGSSGDPSQIYRVSLEGKFFAPSLGRFSLYLATGTSYTTEHIGQLKIISTYMNGPDRESIHPSRTNNYWAHTVGLGFRYFLWEDFGVEVVGKWYSNYSTRFHKTLTFGLVYKL